MSQLDKEKKAIEELAKSQQGMISLRYLLGSAKWDDDESQKLALDHSERILQGLHEGLSLLTSSSWKSLKTEPSADTVSVNANGNKKANIISAPVNVNSNKKANISAPADGNSRDKKRRRCDVDSWMRTDNPYDDGYLWSKYGERKIKNSQHPRSYYRCRRDGCEATKLVQQCNDSNPPVFYVEYAKEHTCISADAVPPPTPMAIPPPLPEQAKQEAEQQELVQPNESTELEHVYGGELLNLSGIDNHSLPMNLTSNVVEAPESVNQGRYASSGMFAGAWSSSYD